MAAIKAAPAGDVLERSDLEVNSADAAGIAERIGVSEEEVRRVLNDSDRVRTVMRERYLPVDLAVFVLVANAQARRRKDAVVTVPAGE